MLPIISHTLGTVHKLSVRLHQMRRHHMYRAVTFRYATIQPFDGSLVALCCSRHSVHNPTAQSERVVPKPFRRLDTTTVSLLALGTKGSAGYRLLSSMPA